MRDTPPSLLVDTHRFFHCSLLLTHIFCHLTLSLLGCLRLFSPLWNTYLADLSTCHTTLVPLLLYQPTLHDTIISFPPFHSVLLKVHIHLKENCFGCLHCISYSFVPYSCFIDNSFARFAINNLLPYKCALQCSKQTSPYLFAQFFFLSVLSLSLPLCCPHWKYCQNV